MTPEEKTRKNFTEGFYTIFKRKPKDQDELLTFILASWLGQTENTQLLLDCMQQAAAAYWSATGTEAYNKAKEKTSFSTYCVTTFGRALIMLADIYTMSVMEKEVNEMLSKAEEMKPTD